MIDAHDHCCINNCNQIMMMKNYARFEMGKFCTIKIEKFMPREKGATTSILYSCNVILRN